MTQNNEKTVFSLHDFQELLNIKPLKIASHSMLPLWRYKQVKLPSVTRNEGRDLARRIKSKSEFSATAYILIKDCVAAWVLQSPLLFRLLSWALLCQILCAPQDAYHHTWDVRGKDAPQFINSQQTCCKFVSSGYEPKSRRWRLAFMDVKCVFFVCTSVLNLLPSTPVWCLRCSDHSEAVLMIRRRKEREIGLKRESENANGSVCFSAH